MLLGRRQPLPPIILLSLLLLWCWHRGENCTKHAPVRPSVRQPATRCKNLPIRVTQITKRFINFLSFCRHSCCSSDCFVSSAPSRPKHVLTNHDTNSNILEMMWVKQCVTFATFSLYFLSFIIFSVVVAIAAVTHFREAPAHLADFFLCRVGPCCANHHRRRRHHLLPYCASRCCCCSHCLIWSTCRRCCRFCCCCGVRSMLCLHLPLCFIIVPVDLASLLPSTIIHPLLLLLLRCSQRQWSWWQQ